MGIKCRSLSHTSCRLVLKLSSYQNTNYQFAEHFLQYSRHAKTMLDSYGNNKLSGWLALMDNFEFYVLLTIFQSYQDDRMVIMKGCVPRNPVYGRKDFRLQQLSDSGPLDQQINSYRGPCRLAHQCIRTTNFIVYTPCTTIHRYPIVSTRYSVMCKVYTGYCGTSEIEHGLCACTVDNPLAKARGLSLRTGAQTMLYFTCMNPKAQWQGAPD